MINLKYIKFLKGFTMKRKAKLLMISLMSVLLVFSLVFASNAADTASVEEVTLQVTKNGITTTRSGSFDSFMAEIDALTTAETENTVYSMVVNKDFKIGGKGYWEFRSVSPTVTFNFDLNGHTVTATKGNVFQIRTGYTLNIDGADENGKAGTWRATGSAASMFFPRDVATTIKAANLNIEATNLSQTGQPVLHILKGDVSLTNVKMTYTGADFPSSGTVEDKKFVVAGNGSLTLDNCTIEDKSDGKLKFTSINTYSTEELSVKNSSFDSYYGFRGTATTTIENSSVTVIDDIFAGSCSVTVTDSELATAKSTFTSSSGTVTFKYGTGKGSLTLASGSVPSGNYSIEDEGYSFVSAGNGKYVLLSTAGLEEVTVITEKNGSSTTKSCSFDSFMLELDNQETSLSENTSYTVIVNKDFTVGGKKWWELKQMSPTATLNIDLNGHTVTSPSGNVVQVRTAYTLNIDGADENGNVGTWRAIGQSASMFYMQKSAGANARANIENLNIVCTNLSQTSQPVLHLQSGTTVMKNVRVTYTGADFPTNGTIEDKSIIMMRESANLILENCTLEDKGSGKLKFYAITATTKASFMLDNVTVSSYYGFNCTGGANVIENSNITVSDNAFMGTAAATVTDTEIKTVNSTFTSSTGKITFNYGTGKTSVTVADGANLTGNYETEEGYAFLPYGNGKYVLGSDEGVSTVAMTSIFADGMVFQRDLPINVFGTCRKVGAEIKVTLGGETVIATVDSAGRFVATFSARGAAKGITLTVEQLGVDTPVVHAYNNIAIGEVVVISGQSNAAYELYKMEDAAEYIANADNYSNIKVFRAPRTYEFREVTEGTGSWHSVNSKTLLKDGGISGDVSAVGYVLATRMADALGDDVTIALVDATYAGSGIYPWIEYGAFVDEFGDTTYSNVQAGIKRYREYNAYYAQNGKYPSSTNELSSYLEKPYNHTPGICYNTMIAPIEGYAARCVVWYQGETNSSNLKTTYDIFFEALKDGYKKAFANEELKFFTVQLAPHTSDYSEFRAMQYTLGDAEDTFVVNAAREGSVMTSSDLSQGYIHPARKSPVGHRLADSILKHVYGFYADDIVEAPRVVSVTLDEGNVIVTFDTVLSISYGAVLEGFEIAGADKSFKKATGEISGNTVTLTADGIETAVYVRYGFGVMNIVLNDGTVIPYNSSLSNSITTEQAIVVGPDGTEYVFDKDCGLVIESRLSGNLTNESGYPAPTFMLEVGYGA